MKVNSAVMNTSVFTGLQRAGAVALLVVATTLSAHAQLTNNPYAVNTTNTTVLSPIGTYGFGVALLGYPMQTPATNFFSDNLDGVALSDASTATDQVGMLQFYAANEDNSIAPSRWAYNVVGFRVLMPTANPNQMTVYRSFVASIQTNNATANTPPDGGYGAGCAGGFGMGGVSKNGTIVVRMDAGTSAPASPGMAGEGVVQFPANVPTTIICTNGAQVLSNGGQVLVVDSTTGNVPQIGQNGNLVVKNSFNGVSYVARPDITPANAGTLAFAPSPHPTPHNATNGQAIVNSGTPGFYNNLGSWNTRGVMGMNDTAKIMTTYMKTANDEAPNAASDSMTGLVVIHYTDAGGPITPISLQTNIFGSTVLVTNIVGSVTNVATMISTNGQYFFSRVPFNGPAQESINDSGAVAFAVSININADADPTNGTRAAQVTGILYMPPNSTNFLKVCDNTDPTLFLQVPLACTNKNLISDVAVDDYNNVYFEAAYTNNTSFIFTNCTYTTDTNTMIITTNCFADGTCDSFPSNAVYEAVANDALNPTSWSVRILLRQGDTFTNTVSGDIFQVYELNYEGSPSIATVSQRSFGPNAINRSQLPGHTIANTAPSSPFAVGGILVQATLTNLTRGVRTDGLLYLAPYTSACAPLPFVITSITRSGNDINLVYNAQTGTNVIQVSPGIGASGSYTNGTYTDLATNIVTGCPASASYTDIGGGTNRPTRYYRVNLRE